MICILLYSFKINGVVYFQPMKSLLILCTTSWSLEATRLYQCNPLLLQAKCMCQSATRAMQLKQINFLLTASTGVFAQNAWMKPSSLTTQCKLNMNLVWLPVQDASVLVRRDALSKLMFNNWLRWSMCHKSVMHTWIVPMPLKLKSLSCYK